MKSRFMATIICLVLVLAVLPLGAWSQGGGGLFKPVSAAPMSVTEPESPSVVNPAITSPYDGTYTGVYTYRYRVSRYDDKLRNYVQGKWVTNALRLTLTFKSLGSSAGVTYLRITSVSCSDPNFGALSSVTLPEPLIIDSGGTLPAEPPTTPLNQSQYGWGVMISFPNGSSLITNGSVAGALEVGFEGRTISNSLDPAIKG